MPDAIPCTYTPRRRSDHRAITPTPSITALRIRCEPPIGFADQAPKQAQTGRRPCDSRRTISAVNANVSPIAAQAAHGCSSWAINAAPTTVVAATRSPNSRYPASAANTNRT